MTGTLRAMENVEQSHLSSDPDVAGLADLIREMSNRAVVDEDSIEFDEITGIWSGRFRVEDSGIEGEFERRDNRYQFRIQGPSDEGEWAIAKELNFSFDPSEGSVDSAWAGVQFHPNLRKLPEDSAQEERIVGWQSSFDRFGVESTPITARHLGDGAWSIGHSSTIEKRTMDSLDTQHFYQWYRLVQPFVK